MLKRNRTFFTILGMLLFAGLVVNLLFTQPSTQTPEQKIAFGLRKNLPALTAKGYLQLVKANPDSIDYHYNLIYYAFKKMDSSRVFTYQVQPVPLDSIHSYYLDLSNQSNISQADLGYWGLGMFFYFADHDYAFAEISFNRIQNTKLKYLRYMQGLNYLQMGQTLRAERLWQEEIASSGGFKEGAYRELVKLLYQEDRMDELKELLNSPESKLYFPRGYASQLYFQQNKFGLYFQNLIRQVTDRVDLAGFFAALLVMFIWLFYLKRLDVFSKTGWAVPVLVLLLGMLFSLGTFYLSDLNEFKLKWVTKGSQWDNLLYNIVGIGMVEELVKIIPLLFLLWFTPFVKSPYDYIRYAAISALGFAFVENLLYYDGSRTDIIHGRALVSVVGHLFNSSLIAYGLVLSRYRYKYLLAPIAFIVFFALAACIHGLFNFWLLSKAAIIFLLFYMMCVRIWITFIRNTLNHSPYFSYKLAVNTNNITYYLVVTLTGILVFEYMLAGYESGATVANNSLIESSLSGSFLILFLSTRLSSVQLIQDYWNPIKVSLIPPQPESFDFLNLISKKVIINNLLPAHEEDKTPKELKGRITDRKRMSPKVSLPSSVSSKRFWILIKLDEPWLYGTQQYTYFFATRQTSSGTPDKNLSFYGIPATLSSNQTPVVDTTSTLFSGTMSLAEPLNNKYTYA